MLSEEEQTHTMILQTTHESGAEEWYCPTCGRRIIFQWPPDFKKTVLVPGDEYASHSGGKGGFMVGKPQLVKQTELPAQNAPVLSYHDENVQLSAQDKARLVQWEQWLGRMGFENHWSSDS